MSLAVKQAFWMCMSVFLFMDTILQPVLAMRVHHRLDQKERNRRDGAVRSYRTFARGLKEQSGARGHDQNLETRDLHPADRTEIDARKLTIILTLRSCVMWWCIRNPNIHLPQYLTHIFTFPIFYS